MKRNLRLGFALLCLGFITGCLSILMLFDALFLKVSNAFVVAGLFCILGSRKFLSFFSNPSRVKGTLAYFGGILAVFLAWVKTGFILETIGLYLLFGAFLPNIVSYIRVTPFNVILELPVIRDLVGYIQDPSKLPM
ncbi:putative CGI-141 protein-like protein [Babesia divergens]|uniref:CGI-141 protein-like protein n=1 Tax=Babesia divergens TaxID=32595 RepID=A0AAD9GHH3_BABDI|nr:putative CGI-141 protein-like protein [Babesia divergens]